MAYAFRTCRIPVVRGARASLQQRAASRAASVLTAMRSPQLVPLPWQLPAASMSMAAAVDVAQAASPAAKHAAAESRMTALTVEVGIVDAAATGETGPGTVQLTDAAAKEILRRAASRQESIRQATVESGAADAAESFTFPARMRLEVEGGHGCNGFQYKFGWAINQAAFTDPSQDSVLQHPLGAQVVVDNASMSHLLGCVFDFEQDLMGSRFWVSENPNADSSCGCGTSFSPKMDDVFADDDSDDEDSDSDSDSE